MLFTKYVRTLGLTFSLCVLTFFLLVLFQINAPTQSSLWISQIYQIKRDIARSVDPPKLVLVGGSDLLFGVSCQMIHESLDVPCVNGGTHAGLDTEYLLHAAKPFLQPGDTALFSLPYDLYKDEGKLRNVLIDYVLARDPEYLLSSGWHSVFFFTGVTFDRLIEGYLAKVSPPAPDPFARYQAKKLNQYGDETVNLAPGSEDEFAAQIAERGPQPEILGYVDSSYGMDRIREFADWCQQKNVRLLVTYPNTIWFDEYDEEENRRVFFQSIEDFHRSLNVPIVGQYKDFLYDKTLIYDTIYHLNGKGVRKRTETLIELLRPLFNE